VSVDPDVAVHEAGHTGGMLYLGRPPLRVRADHPDLDYNLSGVTEPDLGDGITREMASDLLLAVLLGPIAEGEADWPPPWPLEVEADAPRSDASQLARLAKFMRLDGRQWLAYVAIAYHLADDPAFKALHALITEALHRAPVITGRQLVELIGPEWRERFEIDQPRED
jgi:hypothetical protein